MLYSAPFANIPDDNACITTTKLRETGLGAPVYDETEQQNDYI